MLSGSKHPKIFLFNFEKRSAGVEGSRHATSSTTGLLFDHISAGLLQPVYRFSHPENCMFKAVQRRGEGGVLWPWHHMRMLKTYPALEAFPGLRLSHWRCCMLPLLLHGSTYQSRLRASPTGQMEGRPWTVSRASAAHDRDFVCFENETFVGYFDPENIIFFNKNTWPIRRRSHTSSQFPGTRNRFPSVLRSV